MTRRYRSCPSEKPAPDKAGALTSRRRHLTPPAGRSSVSVRLRRPQGASRGTQNLPERLGGVPSDLPERISRRSCSSGANRFGGALRATPDRRGLPTSSPSANPVGVIGGPSCRRSCSPRKTVRRVSARLRGPLRARRAVPGCARAPLLIWLVGSRNPFTPAGYVGYLTKGAVFGKSTFYGVQRGPTSTGPHLAARRHQRQRHAVHLHPRTSPATRRC